MKVWFVAWNTYRGLLRNRALLVIALIFLFPWLTSAGMLYYTTQLKEAGAVEQSRMMLAFQLEGVLQFTAALAYVLVVAAAASLLPGEIRTGTILPTLGRSLSRLQFLLGLFLGVNGLLLTYLLAAGTAMAGMMLWGGIALSPPMLIGLLHVLLVANIVAAITFFFAAAVNHLALAPVGTIFLLSLPEFMEAVKLWSQPWGERLRSAAEYLLPAWDLISVRDYFLLTRSPATRSLEFHLVGLVHALDYLVVFLLLTWLVFRRRSLLPPS